MPGPRYSTAQRPGHELLEFCRDRETDVVRFSLDIRIWPTNNISERDLRPTTTQQKISGRLASETVTQDRLDIRSCIDTAPQNGFNAMTALRRGRRRQPLATTKPHTSLNPTPPHSTTSTMDPLYTATCHVKFTINIFRSAQR